MLLLLLLISARRPPVEAGTTSCDLGLTGIVYVGNVFVSILYHERALN